METLTANHRKYIFQKHPKKKGTCPNCKTKGTFRYYEGFPPEYGKCDRENNCGHHNKPNGSINGYALALAKPEPKIIYPSEQLCVDILNDQKSNFHKFCKEHLKITDEHLRKWNVGTKGNETAFVYQNKASRYVNIVHIEYGSNGKRNKEKHPYSLKAVSGNEKYSLNLFGEHLLSSNKIICLVESEKTACIASSFYPHFDWLATGGNNKLTGEKIHALFNRKIYYLNDADKAGKENSTLKRLREYQQDFQIINLYPDRSDGYDLADAIIDELRPEIKPPAPETDVKKIKEARVSVFRQVEIYLNELYDTRYNEISNEIEYRLKKEVQYKPLNENNIYRALQHNHIKFSQSNLMALLRSDFVKVYNPFEDYFDSLPLWDPETGIDYIDKLSEYINAKQPERFKMHFKKMLIRSIACALTDGNFNKQAFILVHDKQNSGKSTFCRWLCPAQLKSYYAENISIDKDSLISLSENFFINLDELATLSKVELNTLKSMFSKDYIKIRRPFEKKPAVTPRRANFIGSTNKTEFLTDETGSVRWLCFEIEGINWDYQKDIDIDMVWSQAYTLFKSGFKYQLSENEIIENEMVNKGFQITTPEMELIQQNYLPGAKEKHELFYTASEMQHNLMKKYENNVKLNTNNIGKALKMLGFEKSQKFNGAYPVKGYYINILRE